MRDVQQHKLHFQERWHLQGDCDKVVSKRSGPNFLSCVLCNYVCQPTTQGCWIPVCSRRPVWKSHLQCPTVARTHHSHHVNKVTTCPKNKDVLGLITPRIFRSPDNRAERTVGVMSADDTKLEGVGGLQIRAAGQGTLTNRRSGLMSTMDSSSVKCKLLNLKHSPMQW